MTNRHRHRARTGAAMLATAITLTGCTSTASEGTAEAAAADTTTAERTAALIPAAPGEPDPARFSTRPSDYPATAGDNGIGSIIESQRMAEFLVLPAEVDPALTEEYLDLTRPIFGPIPLAYLLADTDSTIEQIGAETGIIAGFSTARFTKDSRARMVHAVLRFHDAAGAGDAASQLHERLLDPAVSGPTAAPHPLATMPESLVHTVETEFSRSVAALTQHRHYLIYTFVDSPTDRASWADGALQHALELQRPMLDRFPATAPSELRNLPVDIDDMLRRTLRYPDGAEGAQVPAVYGPRGAAHLLAQLDTLDMFADTAATHMARDATFVYRTDATDRAETLFDRVVAQIRDKNDDISVVSAAGPPGVPDARCFEVITPYSEGASCALLYDTYVTEIRTKTLQGAHQATSAQYLIFQATDTD
ncbi:DUF7373 family lipoprotein [Rhodococcus pyridinivorans]